MKFYRRGGKGRWKPYRTLSLKEKIAQEEKEERNAVEKREKLVTMKIFALLDKRQVRRRIGSFRNFHKSSFILSL